MNTLKSYLMQICSLGFFTSLLFAVIPNGRIRRIAQFTGSLLLVLAVVKPIVSLDEDVLARAISKFNMTQHQQQTGIELQNRSILEEVIKMRCEEYISDKAEALGIVVSAEIMLSKDGDYPYPVSVILHSDAIRSDRDHLENIIAQDLGIPPERQEWK